MTEFASMTLRIVKRLFLPFLVGIISSIIPGILGFNIETWQYWIIAAPIIIMSWTIVPIHNSINKDN